MTTRRGARWTEDDDAELRQRVAAKQTIAQIAREDDGRHTRPGGCPADHAAIVGAAVA
jgi:hypothetical protein